ncbi:MAG: F-type H+-transporting ATPase subunit delta [Chloroflexi bacterium]|jgi:F-type H+-transporting ATPase subunit delta|nr:MAG: F-type H+-transporting ATPase subunit delta [Chloroflexota bacterium]|tara:strand:+ start:379 stop:909 length:531 start_codon:yes stop_codon:yes gene_type:complete
MAVIVTKRFAQAAFDIAAKEGKLDSWITDMNLIKDLLGNEGVVEFFNSPRLPFTKKLESLDILIKDKVSSSSRNMMALLINRKGVEALETIIKEFKAIIDTQNNVARGQIISAIPLNDKQLLEIKDSLQGCIGNELILTNIVDESIIGGMVARIGDKLIDASLRHKITKMRSDLAR